MNFKRKRKGLDVAETSKKKTKRSIVSVLTDHCNIKKNISVSKRRARDDGQMSKSMRCSNLSNPSQHNDVSMEDVRIQKGKRKASDDAERSKKKVRCAIKTRSNESRMISEEESSEQIKKRKASHDGGAPKKRTRASSSSSTGSSTTESSSSSPHQSVRSDDNRDVSDISLIFNGVSPEDEKIYEMSSSGNTSRCKLIA